MNERLGKTFKDIISGFEGVATGHCEYLTGCNQTLLQPERLEGGNPVESRWFDDQRLEHMNKGTIILNNGETPGCDREAPKR